MKSPYGSQTAQTKQGNLTAPFSNKQPLAVAGNATFPINLNNGTQVTGNITLVGDATGSGPTTGNIALTLANSSATRGNLGLGNVSTLNLNGNASTVLLGNGAFGAFGNVGALTLNGNGSTALRGNGTFIAIGNASQVDLNGNATQFLSGNGGFAVPAGTGGNASYPIALNTTQVTGNLPGANVSGNISGLSAGITGNITLTGSVTGTGNTQTGIATTLNITLSQGNYTPTLFNTTNINANTSRQATFMRVGNMVMVAGQLDVTLTGTGLTQLGVSLPVASALSNAFQLGGSGSAESGAADTAVFIYADAANDRAKFEYYGVASGAQSISYHYGYEVL